MKARMSERFRAVIKNPAYKKLLIMDTLGYKKAKIVKEDGKYKVIEINDK